jgi:hypothetical protein
MNAPLLPQILLSRERSAQASLELATEGVQRYVWTSDWGDMLIEVRNGAVYVNGKRVEAAPTADRRA